MASAKEFYEAAAHDYLRGLPLEHFMEATSQATQREITLASLALLKTRRLDLHVFNELLVQFPSTDRRRPGQVVPDNMVVLSAETIKAKSSFNTPLESAMPFWVLDYASKTNRRKDYSDHFDQYEQHLKVPYFLLFYPDDQELTLYRHTGKRYQSMRPTTEGRYPIAELDIEVAVQDGWVRFWYQAELLLLPAELQSRYEEAQRRIEDAQRRTEEAERLTEEFAQRIAAAQEARQTAERELAELQTRLQQSSQGSRGTNTTQ